MNMHSTRGWRATGLQATKSTEIQTQHEPVTARAHTRCEHSMSAAEWDACLRRIDSWHGCGGLRFGFDPWCADGPLCGTVLGKCPPARGVLEAPQHEGKSQPTDCTRKGQLLTMRCSSVLMRLPMALRTPLHIQCRLKSSASPPRAIAFSSMMRTWVHHTRARTGSLANSPHDGAASLKWHGIELRTACRWRSPWPEGREPNWPEWRLTSGYGRKGTSSRLSLVVCAPRQRW